MGKALGPRIKEMARELAVQGLSLSVISKRLDVNENTLSTWSKRGRWTELRSNVCEKLAEAGQKLAAESLAETSFNVRRSLAGELAAQTEILAQNPAQNPDDLANSPKRQGRAGVLKTLSDSAKVVFNWGDEPGAMLFMGCPTEPVIDVAEGVVSPPADTLENKPSLVTAGD